MSIFCKRVSVSDVIKKNYRHSLLDDEIFKQLIKQDISKALGVFETYNRGYRDEDFGLIKAQKMALCIMLHYLQNNDMKACKKFNFHVQFDLTESIFSRLTNDAINIGNVEAARYFLMELMEGDKKSA